VFLKLFLHIFQGDRIVVQGDRIVMQGDRIVMQGDRIVMQKCRIVTARKHCVLKLFCKVFGGGGANKAVAK
jgi:hypothetical protein